MWDLKVIVALNQVASELARAGKNPAQAMSELARRARERKNEESTITNHQQSEGDNKGE